jgi:hypothetical protein
MAWQEGSPTESCSTALLNRRKGPPSEPLPGSWTEKYSSYFRGAVQAALAGATFCWLLFAADPVAITVE